MRFSSLDAEMARVGMLYRYERELAAKGITAIAGTDEVGRGPLAGPVTAAAVILPLGEFIPGLRDSKLVPEKEREWIASRIRERAISWAVAMVEAEDIDRINILQASIEAMRLAVLRLTVPPGHLIIDALQIGSLAIPQTSLVRGDSLSASVAAASIAAKVTRDRLMVQWDTIYPAYGFRSNKGYPTPQHLHALQVHGPCPLHRKTFSGVKELLNVR